MLQFDKVWKTYNQDVFKKSQAACQDVSFNLSPGKTIGLIGANGAGKSTCIRLIMDFIRPNKGAIRIFNGSPSKPRIRERIGYLPETANFPANLTVLDLLRFTAKTCNMGRDLLSHRSQELLTMLDLWEARKRPLRSYSKGMQQRANFAIALINDPELLILDEPMSGLDPMGRKKIIDLIEQLKLSGKTILFCSHILEDVDRLVDNILLLHKGKSLFLGKPADLIAEQESTTLAEAFVYRVKKGETHG